MKRVLDPTAALAWLFAWYPAKNRYSMTSAPLVGKYRRNPRLWKEHSSDARLDHTLYFSLDSSRKVRKFLARDQRELTLEELLLAINVRAIGTALLLFPALLGLYFSAGSLLESTSVVAVCVFGASGAIATWTLLYMCRYWWRFNGVRKGFVVDQPATRKDRWNRYLITPNLLEWTVLPLWLAVGLAWNGIAGLRPPVGSFQD